VGIKATMARLSGAVRAADEELWEHLERGQRINPQFYAFRWITLALTQEFAFPDAVRLWDSLLSDPAGRTDCLLRLCTAMLLHVRQELLEVRGAQAGCTNRRRSAVLQPDKWRRPRGLLWGSAAVWRLDSHRRALRQPCRATLPPT
jgi:hypothetical protein